MKVIKGALLLALCMAPAATLATPTFLINTDITAQLRSLIASGDGGIKQNRALITLPPGVFYLSGSVDLHGSTLQGAGPNQTFIDFAHDLGSGVSGLTGDPTSPYGNFEIDNLTIQGPRPSTAVAPGQVPSQMNGVHLYDDCVLHDVNLNFFNAGVLMDGNHHKVESVIANQNYYGIEWVVSTDGSYYDDYVVDSIFVANGRAGIAVDANSQIGGSTFIRVHTGIEPYGIYLGHNARIGNCQFMQTQFEGVGNADIGDSDGTSTLNGNTFSECCGWGGRYDNAISTEPTKPSMRVGTFLSNMCFSNENEGPTPGDMTAAQGCYDNTWLTDAITLGSILSRGLSPIVAPPSNTYGNSMVISGIGYMSRTATVLIEPNTIVQADGGRYQGCIPLSGNGVALGQNLAVATPGTIAWISNPNAAATALTGHMPNPAF